MTNMTITLPCCSDQAGEVVSVAVHPSHDYMITAAGDGTWAFYDVNAALCLTQVTHALQTSFLAGCPTAAGTGRAYLKGCSEDEGLVQMEAGRGSTGGGDPITGLLRTANPALLTTTC